MRQIFLPAALVLAMTVAAAEAQDTDTTPSGPPPTQRTPMAGSGPISGGVYHQPTRAEIEQRERDSRAAQQRSQQESKEVDELYNQLIHPAQPAGAPK